MDTLKKNIHGVKIGDKIRICCYTLDNRGMKPFLKFLLHDSLDLNFPQVELYDINTKQIISMTRKYLFDVLQYEPALCYKGYQNINRQPFVFYEMTDCDKKDKLFCLVDEIVNLKQVSGKQVNPFATQFVIDNINLFLLRDQNQKLVEIPSVVYVGRSEEELEATYTFGVGKSLDDMTMGPYYYFTDFDNAAKHYGVVRIAIFNGATLVKLNDPDDDVDESFVKKQRLNDPTLEKHYEVMTMRITDCDGKWASVYDSVSIGCLELDDGRMYQNAPLIVVKTHEQQIPLSFHIVQTNV